MPPDPLPTPRTPLPSRCPACDYDTAGLTRDECPECGCDIRREYALRADEKPAIFIVILLLIAAPVWFCFALAITASAMDDNGFPLSAHPLALSFQLIGFTSIATLLFALVLPSRIRRASSAVYNTLFLFSWFMFVPVFLLVFFALFAR